MAHIVNANEEIQIRKKRKKMSNFKIDVDIILLVFSIIVKVRNVASRIPQISRWNAYSCDDKWKGFI